MSAAGAVREYVGSGKSTVVSLLERWYEPTAGAIYVDGVPLSSLDASWWRRQVALVAQVTRARRNLPQSPLVVAKAGRTGRAIPPRNLPQSPAIPHNPAAISQNLPSWWRRQVAPVAQVTPAISRIQVQDRSESAS